MWDDGFDGALALRELAASGTMLKDGESYSG